MTANVLSLDLQSIVKPEQAVVFEYPDFEGFKITLCYLGREKLSTIRKDCVVKKLNKGGLDETLDLEKFNRLYSRAVIKGWEGLKLAYVSQLMLVNLPDSAQMEDTLSYTPENAEALLKHSSAFDTYVTAILGDLSNFTNRG